MIELSQQSLPQTEVLYHSLTWQLLSASVWVDQGNTSCVCVWQAEWKMKSKHLKRDMRWQCKRHQRCGSATDSIPLGIAPIRSFFPFGLALEILWLFMCVCAIKNELDPPLTWAHTYTPIRPLENSEMYTHRETFSIIFLCSSLDFSVSVCGFSFRFRCAFPAKANSTF